MADQVEVLDVVHGGGEDEGELVALDRVAQQVQQNRRLGFWGATGKRQAQRLGQFRVDVESHQHWVRQTSLDVF